MSDVTIPLEIFSSLTFYIDSDPEMNDYLRFGFYNKTEGGLSYNDILTI